MFRLMVLEYQRFCHHLGMVGGCLAKVLLISVLAGQLVIGQQEVVWSFWHCVGDVASRLS